MLAPCKKSYDKPKQHIKQRNERYKSIQIKLLDMKTTMSKMTYTLNRINDRVDTEE